MLPNLMTLNVHYRPHWANLCSKCNNFVNYFLHKNEQQEKKKSITLQKHQINSLFQLNKPNNKISSHKWIEIFANQIDYINVRYASSRDVLSFEMNLKINFQSYSAMQLGISDRSYRQEDIINGVAEFCPSINPTMAVWKQSSTRQKSVPDCLY